MLQSLSGHRLGLVDLKVLRQGATFIINFALLVGLDSCRQSKFRNMLVVPNHGEVVSKTGSIRTRFYVKIIGVIFQSDGIVVSRTDKRQVGGQLVGENMIPPNRSTAVPVAHPNHLLHRKLVIAVIQRKIKTIVFVKNLRHFGIHIIEIQSRFIQILTHKRQNKPRVCSTTRQQHRSFLIKKRRFKHHAARH